MQNCTIREKVNCYISRGFRDSIATQNKIKTLLELLFEILWPHKMEQSGTQ